MKCQVDVNGCNRDGCEACRSPKRLKYLHGVDEFKNSLDPSSGVVFFLADPVPEASVPILKWDNLVINSLLDSMMKEGMTADGVHIIYRFVYFCNFAYFTDSNALLTYRGRTFRRLSWDWL